MALTKISGAVIQQNNFSIGVVTTTSATIGAAVTIDSSGVQVGSATTIHTTGIDLGGGTLTSHNINSTGVITATSFVGAVTGNVTGDLSGNVSGTAVTATTASFTNATISGDLIVQGTTTTLDTILTEVDKLEVGANNTTVGVAITQSGTGDILRLYDSGTQVVTVKDGGSVGIGTDNPATKLQVVGTSRFDLGSITTQGPFYINGNKAVSNGAIVHVRNDGVDGTHDVFGGIKFSSSPGYDFVLGKNSRYGTGYFQIRNQADTPLLTIGGTGNVGIGTDNPTGNGSETSTHIHATNYPVLHLTNSTTGTTASDGSELTLNNDGSLILRNRENSFIRFDTNGSERLRIGSNGGVSISNAGTFPTSTNETLNIQGQGHNGHGTTNTRSVVSVTGAITDNANAAGLWIGARTNENTAVIGTRTATGNLAIETYNSGWAERFRIDNVGRVTMPYQPSFAAYDNRGGGTVSASGNISQYFTNAPHNVGGHYATSGANVGRFTAPVAGRYLFGWNFFPYTTAEDASSRMGITVNGNGGSYPGMIQGERLAYTSEGTLLVHLNANDYVRWETQTSAHVYWYNSDPRHNRIWGYFLG